MSKLYFDIKSDTLEAISNWDVRNFVSTPLDFLGNFSFISNDFIKIKEYSN